MELAKLVSLARHSAKPGPEIEETAYFHENRMTHSYGVHLAHVAVEPETGFIDILKYMVVEDVGRCINPSWSMARPLAPPPRDRRDLARRAHLRRRRQLLTTTFRDYVLPSSTDATHRKRHSGRGPLAAQSPLESKEPGEGGMWEPAPRAHQRTVANALRVEIKELPRPEREAHLFDPARRRQLLPETFNFRNNKREQHHHGCRYQKRRRLQAE